MGTVTRLRDVLHARDQIREKNAVGNLRRDPPTGVNEREARMQQYRLKAEELRTIAEDVILYETKQTLLSLSYSYEYMADALERMHLPER